jgi:hypothetical protein
MRIFRNSVRFGGGRAFARAGPKNIFGNQGKAAETSGNQRKDAEIIG